MSVLACMNYLDIYRKVPAQIENLGVNYYVSLAHTNHIQALAGL